jgi:hypothetical protein
MKDDAHLIAWVSRSTKQRFSALAAQQGVSESAAIRRLVEAWLSTVIPSAPSLEPASSVAPSGRLSIRLPEDDLLLLRERATARAMPVATYVSLLVRSHLRRMAPIPVTELSELKRAIGELSAIGRNLNQLARAANSGDRMGASRTDLHALLRACTGLRDAMKALINRNLASWEAGYEKATD